MNTISQTITTLAAISPAAKTTQICEISVTPRMKMSMYAPSGPRTRRPAGRPAGRLRSGAALLDRERLVDQLLAIRYFGGELLIGAVLRDLDPGLVFLGRQRDHFDIVLFEDRDHFIVEALGRLVEVILRLLSSVHQRVLLLFLEPVKASLRHQHRLVHEPQGVVAGRGDALDLLVDT